jgi:hypothetical protein
MRRVMRHTMNKRQANNKLKPAFFPTAAFEDEVFGFRLLIKHPPLAGP